MGADPEKMFVVDEQVLKHTRENAASRAENAHLDWDKRFAEWKQANPDKNQLLERILAGKLPDEIEAVLPVSPPSVLLCRNIGAVQLI